MCIYGVFGLMLAKNIEMDKRPPLMTLLSALGSYWNEYGVLFWKDCSKMNNGIIEFVYDGMDKYVNVIILRLSLGMWPNV